ncbi:hypothetical protein [Paraburkholderia sp. BCC1885]|uniref:hypothetical protein n=1 Tax=Paraburkholderia sp. BCC1885 TaxID=2562669 RepID=UPI001182E244|nr:hypothetical protein [Paraburkholderia sp. BCC1885]
MAASKASKAVQKNVQVDLNNPVFLRNWAALGKDDRSRVLDTVDKVQQMTWSQVYADKGLNWEKITSAEPPKGIDAWYSIRVTQSCRALVYRDGDFMRFLLVKADHDSAYGKK